jgi:hypothetical protein
LIAKECPMHTVMKDTPTFGNEAERIAKWSEIASEIERRKQYEQKG